MIESQETPWVSVLIVCHNDGKWLARCLESIRAQTIFAHLEIVIADNASEDGSDRVAQDLIAGWTNARFLSTGGDRGFCAGTNLAASAATGQYLFVLNPDTWLESDCIEHLHRKVEKAKTGAGGATILNYEDDSLQSECPAGFDFCGNLLLPPKEVVAAFPFSAGGFFFIRRELFQKLGGLDERFFMYCEEQDLAWRIWLAGESIVAVPGARIHHRGAVGVNPGGGGAPLENRTSTQKRFLANRNRLLVIAKNCRGLLLMMIAPCVALVLIEGLATWAITRSWTLARSGCFAALVDLWRLRGHICERRRKISELRCHGDLWMLRFFRLGFGRQAEISKILRGGFPKFSR